MSSGATDVGALLPVELPSGERRSDAMALAATDVDVMLSLFEKTSKAGPPWDDVLPVARAYIEAAPDRIIWGSDWPHPVSVKQPPNEGDLLEFIYRCAPDAAERQRILVDNPADLFGYAKS